MPGQKASLYMRDQWLDGQEKYIIMELRPNIIMCAFLSTKSDVGSRSSGRKPPGPRIGVWSQN